MAACDENSKVEDYHLWQANGLAILEIAISLKIPILNDYSEFIRTQTGHPCEKYRYFMQPNNRVPQPSFPSEILIKTASKYITKKHILQSIANVYGAALKAIETFGR